MKKISLLFLSVVFIASCSTKQQPSDKSDSTKAVSAADSAKAEASEDSVKKDKEVFYYSGLIAGSLKIDAILYFFNDSVTGKYKYSSQTAYLTLKGAKENGQWVIKEYDPKGVNTGRFTSDYFDENKITGTWSSVKKIRTFPFVLMVIDDQQSTGDVLIGTKEVTLMDKQCPCATIMLPYAMDKLYPEKLEAVNKLLTFESLSGESSQEACQCGDSGSTFGIVEGSYSVQYNKNMILSIQWCGETMGAYPDGYCKHININLHTGQKINLEDMLGRSGIDYIIKKCYTEMGNRFTGVMKDPEMDDDTRKSIKQLWDETFYKVDAINDYNFSDKGLVIHLPEALPHAIQAYSPSYDVNVSYEELQEFVTKGSILDGVKSSSTKKSN